MLWLGALGTPVVAISWFLALRAAFSGPGDNSGAFAAMIPLAVFTLFWLFAAQAWWAPVSRVEVAAGELRVTRGRLRTRRRPVGSIQSLKVRRGVLRAGGLALSPKLAGAELRWLAHEIGAALNLPVAGEPRPQ
jgi:membrane protein YdbS with pleckstrin-like domain